MATRTYMDDLEQAEALRIMTKIVTENRIGLDTVIELVGRDHAESVTGGELVRDMIAAENVFLAAY